MNGFETDFSSLVSLTNFIRLRSAATLRNTVAKLHPSRSHEGSSLHFQISKSRVGKRRGLNGDVKENSLKDSQSEAAAVPHSSRVFASKSVKERLAKSYIANDLCTHSTRNVNGKIR